MFSDEALQKAKKDLEEVGVTVVEGVVDHSDCDKFRQQYDEWLSAHGGWPAGKFSLIRTHKVGFMDASWRVRLASKVVFDALWGTKKLLSSIDAVAIGPPPEEGSSRFADPKDLWLHVDQRAARKGVHALQGAVNLETCDEDDWVYVAVPKSHRYHEQFFQKYPDALKRNQSSDEPDFYRLSEEELDWYRRHIEGFSIKRVAVPKGGMVVWDSRIIHSNSSPIAGRENPGRWRYVVFVAMAPAAWATDENLAIKRESYSEMKMTNHWASTETKFIDDAYTKCLQAVSQHPDIAKTDQVRRLAGIEPYDFNDGTPNGPPDPLWDQKLMLGNESVNIHHI